MSDKLQAGHKLHVLIEQEFMIDDYSYVDEISGEPVMPNYSTEMKWAWSLVERLSDKFFFDITDFLPGGWRATFMEKHARDGQVHTVFSIASTPELAICRAALKAKREWQK